MMSSVLLHCCCGPCAAYAVKNLREQGLEVSACWHNPNIHPFTEHRKRLESMQTLAEAWEIPLIVTKGYEMVDFIRAVVGHEKEGERCRDCYRIRLNKTAEIARENGFDKFTSTLLISPYQNHELIRETGNKAAQENGVEFLFEDFSPGFRESHRMARELGLYFQKYCGCIYSEYERYAKVKI
ncbi:MAG: epoxyqueuosine reductase QueH [Dehalococcoidia bacterium]